MGGINHKKWVVYGITIPTLYDFPSSDPEMVRRFGTEYTLRFAKPTALQRPLENGHFVQGGFSTPIF